MKTGTTSGQPPAAKTQAASSLSSRLARLCIGPQAGRRQQDVVGAVCECGREAREQGGHQGEHHAPALLDAGTDGAGIRAQRRVAAQVGGVEWRAAGARVGYVVGRSKRGGAAQLV